MQYAKKSYEKKSQCLSALDLYGLGDFAFCIMVSIVENYNLICLVSINNCIKQSCYKTKITTGKVKAELINIFCTPKTRPWTTLGTFSCKMVCRGVTIKALPVPRKKMAIKTSQIFCV